MPASESPLVIVNPTAGMGRAGSLEPRLRATLNAAGVAARVIETRAAGHAEELAAGAADRGHDRVVGVGGDGTMQEVVNGLLSTPAAERPSMGVVPAGSGNDLSRSLGIPAAPMAALTTALGETVAPLDLGVARAAGRERAFVAAGGTGFDAEVAHTMAGDRARWQRGRAGYFLSTLNVLRRYANRPLEVELDGPDGAQRVEGRFLFIAFANGPYYGGGMQICPAASVSDGVLDICLVGDISRLGALQQLPGIYRARHVTHPLVQIVRAHRIAIRGSDERTRVHLDGEPLADLPVDVGVLPAALQVAVG